MEIVEKSLEERFKDSLKREMEQEKAEAMQPHYFKPTPEFMAGLEAKRGYWITITILKLDGTQRELTGTLGKTKKGRWIINEGHDEAPDYKQFNPNKILKITIEGKEHLPRGSRNDISDAERDQ